MKTIILNQGTLHPSYQSVDNAAYNTWGSTQNPDVRVIHYYGKYNHHNILTDRFPILPDDGNIILDNQTMVIGTYDTTYPSEHPRYDIIPDARNEKFILALEYCLNNFEFDYIQRISTTSYVDVEKMQLYLNKLPKFYGKFFFNQAIDENQNIVIENINDGMLKLKQEINNYEYNKIVDN